MADQPITPAGILRLINTTGLDSNILGSSPTAPGASIARLYPLADGWYSRLGAAGAAMPLSTPPSGSLLPLQLNAVGAAANTVPLLTGSNTWNFGQITTGYFSPGATMLKLGQAELASPASSVVFSSIPQTYKNLMLLVNARSTTVAAVDDISIRLNGDSAANYDFQALEAFLTTVDAFNSSGSGAVHIGDIPAANATANFFGQYVVHFPAYTGAAHKGIIAQGGSRDAASINNMSIQWTHGWWRNVDPVTSVTLIPGAGPNFETGSSFYLYGLPG